jgi:hypothetical protein
LSSPEPEPVNGKEPPLGVFGASLGVTEFGTVVACCPTVVSGSAMVDVVVERRDVSGIVVVVVVEVEVVVTSTVVDVVLVELDVVVVSGTVVVVVVVAVVAVVDVSGIVVVVVLVVDVLVEVEVSSGRVEVVVDVVDVLVEVEVLVDVEVEVEVEVLVDVDVLVEVEVLVEVDVDVEVDVVVVLLLFLQPFTLTFLSEMIVLPTNCPLRFVSSPSAILPSSVRNRPKTSVCFAKLIATSFSPV